MYDSAAGKVIPKAQYYAGVREYAIDVRYVFRTFSENDQVTVIYETATPEKAALYTFWGYWLGWGELLMSVVLCIALFQIAVAVTHHPSEESLTEQLSYKEEKKKKYLD